MILKCFRGMNSALVNLGYYDQSPWFEGNIGDETYMEG